MYGKSNMETDVTICKTDGQREFAVWFKKFKKISEMIDQYKIVFLSVQWDSLGREKLAGCHRNSFS